MSRTARETTEEEAAAAAGSCVVRTSTVVHPATKAKVRDRIHAVRTVCRAVVEEMGEMEAVVVVVEVVVAGEMLFIVDADVQLSTAQSVRPPFFSTSGRLFCRSLQLSIPILHCDLCGTWYCRHRLACGLRVRLPRLAIIVTGTASWLRLRTAHKDHLRRPWLVSRASCILSIYDLEIMTPQGLKRRLSGSGTEAHTMHTPWRLCTSARTVV